MLDEDENLVFEYPGDDELWSELAGDNVNWEPDHHDLTQEDYREIFEKVHPTSLQWKDGADSKNDDVFVTVDEGSNIMRNQAKTEIAFVKKKLTSILGTVSPKIFDLYNLLFGPKSRLGRLLQKDLDLSTEELSKKLGLLMLASVYNLSKTQIFEKQSLVDVEGLVPEDEYQKF